MIINTRKKISKQHNIFIYLKGKRKLNQLNKNSFLQLAFRTLKLNSMFQLIIKPIQVSLYMLHIYAYILLFSSVVLISFYYTSTMHRYNTEIFKNPIQRVRPITVDPNRVCKYIHISKYELRIDFNTF